MERFELEVGHGYTKEALESIFATNFGARIKGITLRRHVDNTPYAIVFSRADGPYTDRVEGNSFFYDGEGTNKDQNLTAANNALVKANETGRVIYGFRQDEAGGLWRYLGILNVLECSYVRKNGFMTYEFHFTADPVSPSEYKNAEAAIDSAIQNTPVLTEETHKVATKSTARSAAFSKNVKKAYDNTCAFCGKKRTSVAGYPEVEAAHIYPKEKDGADDYRNGIALCRLHHWAFDAGLMALDDQLNIVVKQELRADTNYDDIYKYADAPLFRPQNNALKPHLLYVAAHRELHGF